jgi:Ni,Fe-hydrogenase III small subunit
MGDDRKSKTMTEKTPREILDAIDKALKETAVRVAAAKPKRVPHPLRPDRPVPTRPKTPREILDAIDEALAETARRLADRGH